jgi:hypothetical protein
MNKVSEPEPKVNVDLLIDPIRSKRLAPPPMLTKALSAAFKYTLSAASPDVSVEEETVPPIET